MRDIRNKSVDQCFKGITLFADAIVPDGYNGDKVLVELGVKDSTIVVVTMHGYYNAGLPPVLDTIEATWIVNNHPSASIYKVAA